MNRIECLNKFKKDYIAQSVIVRECKDGRFSDTSSLQSQNMIKTNKEIGYTTIMGLLYFFIKWKGSRPASDCISKTRKSTISSFVNSYNIKINYDKIEDVYNQKIYIKRYYHHYVNLSIRSEKVLIPRKIVCYIAKNLADSKQETIDIYNNFCNWIVESDLCKDYLSDQNVRIY